MSMKETPRNQDPRRDLPLVLLERTRGPDLFWRGRRRSPDSASQRQLAAPARCRRANTGTTGKRVAFKVFRVGRRHARSPRVDGLPPRRRTVTADEPPLAQSLGLRGLAAAPCPLRGGWGNAVIDAISTMAHRASSSKNKIGTVITQAGDAGVGKLVPSLAAKSGAEKLSACRTIAQMAAVCRSPTSRASIA